MNDFFQHFYLLLTAIIFSIILGLSACENPGAVGSGLTDSDAEVVTDTLFVDDLQGLEFNSYSGEHDFFSVGQYQDPLFGDMKATGFLKPQLPDFGDTLRTDTKMLMRIILDKSQTHGDTSATQEFDIYEVGELWRGRALRYKDNLQVNTSQKVGSFTVENEDSLDVELSDAYLEEYRQFADTTSSDSLYKYNSFGLAVVPTNSEKIVAIDRESTRFVIQNAQVDSFSVPLNQWGYTLERSSSTIPQGSVPLYSTYESILNFKDLELSEIDVQSSSISRAILILHRNQTTLEQSLQSEPISVVRTDEANVFLQLADPSEIPENIDPGVSANSLTKIQGVFSSEDDSYRFDVTALVESLLQEGTLTEGEFYVTFPNEGAVNSDLIYTNSDQVPDNKKPKIIITSLKNSSN